MIKITKIHLFSFIYFLITFLSTIFFYRTGEKNYFWIIIAQISQHTILLFTFYLLSNKIKINKKENILLYLSILLFNIGDTSYLYYKKYFIISIICYFITYAILSYYLLEKNLKGISFFKIFTFALPFLFTYSAVLILLNEVTSLWLIVLFLPGAASCFLASIVLLNYAYNKTAKNLYIYLGVYTLQLINSLIIILFFTNRLDSYHIPLLLVGYFSQFLIFLSYITHDEEKINNNDIYSI